MATSNKTPTSALLEQVLTLSRKDPEADERWDIVHKLRIRADAKTFDAARKWCSSNDVAARELAADLLGQFGEKIEVDGKPIFPFTDRTVPLLENLIDDPEDRVIASAISSLGHYHVFGPILERPSLAAHSSTDVRLAVACGVARAESKAAIDTLIELSNDKEDDVRDWATFGLGALSHLDTPAMREALFKRLEDKHPDTRSEALVGLARRKDARVIPHIKRALGADSVADLEIEAAGHTGSPDLVKSLEELRSWWKHDTDLLEAALRSCKGESRPDDDRWWAADNEIVVPRWATDKTES